jgi:hypothetical protein
LSDDEFNALSPRERAHILVGLYYFRRALDVGHVDHHFLASVILTANSDRMPISNNGYSDPLKDLVEAVLMLSQRERVALFSEANRLLADDGFETEPAR